MLPFQRGTQLPKAIKRNPIRKERELYSFDLDVVNRGVDQSSSGLVERGTNNQLVTLELDIQGDEQTVALPVQFLRANNKDYVRVDAVTPDGQSADWIALEAGDGDIELKQGVEAVKSGISSQNPEHILRAAKKAKGWKAIGKDLYNNDVYSAYINKRALVQMLNPNIGKIKRSALRTIPGKNRIAIEVTARDGFLISLETDSALGSIDLKLAEANESSIVEPFKEDIALVGSSEEKELFHNGLLINYDYHVNRNQYALKLNARTLDTRTALVGANFLIGNGADGDANSPNGRNGGLLFGNGGNGFSPAFGNGGNGGHGGLFGGNGGNGGNGGAEGSGGHGGNSGFFALFGNGGNGGKGGPGSTGVTGTQGSTGSIGGMGGIGGAGLRGGNGGNAGIFALFGKGGNAGIGGQGGKGGKGGTGGKGLIPGGAGGQGGQGGASGALGGSPGTAGISGLFGAKGSAGAIGAAGLGGDGGNGGDGGDGTAAKPQGGAGGAAGTSGGDGGTSGTPGNPGKNYVAPPPSPSGGGGGGSTAPTFIVNASSGSPYTYSFSGSATGQIQLLGSSSLALTFLRSGISVPKTQTSPTQPTIELSSSANSFTASDFTDAQGLNITGSPTADTIIGSPASDNITGGDSDDTITGGTGADSINAGVGANSITDAGNGADAITHNSAGSTVIIAVTGTDSVTLTASQAGATANGSNGAARTINALTSTAAVVLNGGDGNDQLTGGAGNDTINGGDGNDTIAGGDGGDVMAGGAGNNVFRFNTNDVDAGETVTLTGTTDVFDVVTTTVFDNMNAGAALTGLDDINIAEAQNAEFLSDQLTGLTLTVDGVAGGAVERLIVDASANTGVTINLGNATLSNAVSSITGGTGADTITGTNANDTITGGSGADTLNAGPGVNAYRYTSTTFIDMISEGNDILTSYLGLNTLNTQFVQLASGLLNNGASNRQDYTPGSGATIGANDVILIANNGALGTTNLSTANGALTALTTAYSDRTALVNGDKVLFVASNGTNAYAWLVQQGGAPLASSDFTLVTSFGGVTNIDESVFGGDIAVPALSGAVAGTNIFAIN